MSRIPRTATVAIAAMTALAWVVTAAIGADQQAALALGFIPARMSGAHIDWAALPAFLTPLSSTFVHANFIHLFFNLLLFLWCGSAVERVLGRGSLILLYVVGAYTAAMAQWEHCCSTTEFPSIDALKNFVSRRRIESGAFINNTWQLVRE